MPEYIMQVEFCNVPITVQELVRCKDCKNLSEGRIAPDWNRICRLQGVGKSDDGYCDECERKETEDERGA